MPASLRPDPGRLAPEQVAVILPDWVAEITGIRTLRDKTPIPARNVDLPMYFVLTCPSLRPRGSDTLPELGGQCFSSTRVSRRERFTQELVGSWAWFS